GAAPVAALPLPGDGGDGDQGGDGGAGVGDELLRPVDHPVPVLEAGRGAGAAGVGAGLRLGEAGGGELLAAGEGGQMPFLLRGGAEGEDRHRAEAEPGLEGDGDRLVHAGQLLDGDAQGEVVPALPVVRAGQGQAEQAHRSHLGEDLHRQAALGVVGVAGGGDDLVGEVAHPGGQALVLLAERLGAGRGRGAGGAGRGAGHGGLLVRAGGVQEWVPGPGAVGPSAAASAAATAASRRAWRSAGASTMLPSCVKTPVPWCSAAASTPRAQAAWAGLGRKASRIAATWPGWMHAVAVKPLAAASSAAVRCPASSAISVWIASMALRSWARAARSTLERAWRTTSR